MSILCRDAKYRHCCRFTGAYKRQDSGRRWNGEERVYSIRQKWTHWEAYSYLSTNLIPWKTVSSWCPLTTGITCYGIYLIVVCRFAVKLIKSLYKAVVSKEFKWKEILIGKFWFHTVNISVRHTTLNSSLTMARCIARSLYGWCIRIRA